MKSHFFKISLNNKVIILRRAYIPDLVNLILFFRNLERDLEARRFYRAYRMDNARNIILSAWGIIRGLIYGFLPFSPWKVIYIIMSRSIIPGRNIIAVLHLNLKRGDCRASLGIVIAYGWRGKRLGRLLMKLASAVGIKAGVRYIRLTVDADNVRARRLYTCTGFKTIGICYDFRYISRKKVKCYIMMKKLF